MCVACFPCVCCAMQRLQADFYITIGGSLQAGGTSIPTNPEWLRWTTCMQRLDMEPSAIGTYCRSNAARETFCSTAGGASLEALEFVAQFIPHPNE